MTLLQLKYFVSVCENGSLSKASKILFMTQPALSLAISQLEKEYNLKFFDRKKNILTLTEDGEFFYAKAKSILESVDIFNRNLADLAKDAKTIRIGVPPMIGTFLFPDIYQDYMFTHPDSHFEIWEEGSISIRNKIANKTLDIGFSILNNDPNDVYQKEVILESELLYCVASSNPLALKEALSIEDIKDEPIMLMREGFFQNRVINDMYAKINKTPNISLVSSQLLMIKKFINMNAGGAFLIKELIKGDANIVGIPMLNKLTINIGLLWQKEAELHPQALEFINFLRKNKGKYPK